MLQFDINSTLADLLADMKENLKLTMDTNCGKMAESLTFALESQIKIVNV